MAIATFGLTPAGLAVVEDMALMVVAENWVPYESAYEKKLVDTLAKLRERSVKGLRYNLPAEKPTAAAMLQRQSQPVALYVVPPSADDAYDEALEELISSRPEIGAWIWRTAEGEMPPLWYFARAIRIVHCNIRAAGYLLLPDAMPMLDAVHLLPRRIRKSSPLPPPPGSGLFSFGDYARRMA
jgi:hypothetical protein